jgi:arylsulfatase
MGRLSENSVVSIKDKSFSVTADIEVPAGETTGVIIAQGGRFGGWALYANGGKAKFVYNVLGIHRLPVEAEDPSRPAPTRCAWSSPTTAAAWPRAATSPSTTTASRSARAASASPRPWCSPPTRRPTSGTSREPRSRRTTRPGRAGSPARSTGYSSTSGDDHDHYIEPEERIRIAMARQ